MSDETQYDGRPPVLFNGKVKFFNESNPLSVGDSVMLKSGSPLMTITALMADRRGPVAICTWTTDRGNIEAAVFGAQTLLTEADWCRANRPPITPSGITSGSAG